MTPSFGQKSSFPEKIIQQDSLHLYESREKIFIHTDKPIYRLRDTLWLKGYLLTAAENLPNDSSRITYIEIFDRQNQLARRVSAYTRWGLFSSHIILHENEFTQGGYQLRAYTQKMRGFGDSLFFQLPFSIIDPAADIWNLKVNTLRFIDNRLVFSGFIPDHEKLAGKSISVKLRSGNRSVFNSTLAVSTDGMLALDTIIERGSKDNLELEISGKNMAAWRMPIRNIQSQQVDIQFLPEGGTFIAGREQRLGFKAINSLGKGVAVKGVIKDSKGNVITSFQSVHAGMGVVSLTPQLQETYTAVLDNGSTIPLPLAAASGISLQVFNTDNEDSLRIKIEASDQLKGQAIYFSISSRGYSIVRGRSVFHGQPVRFAADKKNFPSGVSVVTVYDSSMLPVAERAFFIWHKDALQLSMTTDRPFYYNKDSVSLSLTTTDHSGKMISGSFSMAVIDTSQVKIDLTSDNLLSYMLLSADLKGPIENSYYYFQSPHPEAREALMLTQGWVSYRRLSYHSPFTYEKDFVLKGKVTNIFNKAVSNSNVTLFGKAGKNNAFLADTLTNDKGEFSFSELPVFNTDSISLVLRALNKRDKAFNVGIDLQENSYPLPPVFQPGLSPNIEMDTVTRKYMSRREQIREELRKDGTYLEEVIVTAKAKIPGSKNLNKDGGADQTINESSLDKVPKETLYDVLMKQVKGFRIGSLPKNPEQRYLINTNMVRLVIDGMDIEFFYESFTGMPNEYIQYYDRYLKYILAEDVRGIEVMNNPRYNSSYRSQYLTISEQINSGPATRDYSFIEVTTKDGTGPFLKKTPGMYLLKPAYPYVSKSFYSPRYSSPDETTIFPDLRTTVYWNPYVITNENGKANVSFFTSENRSGYLVIVQGTDLQGGIGILYQGIEVRKKE